MGVRVEFAASAKDSYVVKNQPQRIRHRQIRTSKHIIVWNTPYLISVPTANRITLESPTSWSYLRPYKQKRTRNIQTNVLNPIALIHISSVNWTLANRVYDRAFFPYLVHSQKLKTLVNVWLLFTLSLHCVTDGVTLTRFYMYNI